ncbi:aspartate/glutamate racemase family protein [Mariniblastus fucicola]|uniref:Putative amino-acid racemase n=1 Tax=Mariniblastus fucicola TaxID=980251 RepID=A0A5B9PF25_9BACT|nr:amino acid racemase [Mariniblastus fucicola]QEG21503.1 putative amino-acid racemase [Mariniblastus fucicola]
MRTLGLIGGTSWHSTIEYYREINQAVNEHFGNNTNPPLMLYSLNQFAIHAFQREGRWDEIARLISDAAERLEKGGAEGLMFCANTPHKVYETVLTAVNVPIIHICDATSKAIQSKQISKVGLIGTRFTMEESFMVDRFAANGVEAIVPESAAEVTELHRIIQEELTFGNIESRSKSFVHRAIGSLIQRGAEGIVLGCTEFPLMFAAGELQVPTFSTTEIHARAATEFVLAD